jgi:peptidyl-prolyl cis-trans isomerase SurA
MKIFYENGCMSRNSLRMVWVLALSLFYVCQSATMASGEVVDRIVAVVNDDIILLSELEETLQPYLERIKKMNYSLDQEKKMIFKLREDLLSKMVDGKLTDQEVKRMDIQVGEKEIDNAIERLKEDNLYTDEQLREFFASNGMTMEEYRERIKEQILRSKLVNYQIKSKIVITNEDIEAYFQKNQIQYGGEKTYRLRSIILESDGLSSDFGDTGLKDKKETIFAELKSGQSFGVVAKAYSESSFASEGGYLGEFKYSTLSPQLQEAVKDLKTGDLTDWLETDYGEQLFFIESATQSSGKSLEEATPEIEKKLFTEIVNEKFSAWLEELRRRSHIKTII